ncbi:MAG: MinD/ParA family protein [Actinomycetota bacterium]|nr:MAG: MinD/ParA family protein [Actinomycetota bacterium]
MTAIVEFDPNGADALLGALGGDGLVLPGLNALREHLDGAIWEDTVVLGPSVDQGAALDLALEMRVNRPSLGVILVRRRIDTAVLSDALRSGVREVVQERDLTGLTEAVTRVKHLARAMRETTDSGENGEYGERRARVLTVFSAKGGCGKTTLATNLAVGLATSKRGTVVLVDLDLSFGDVSIALQMFPTHTIGDAIALGTSMDKQAVLQLLTPHSSGVMVLAAPPDPSTAEKIETSLVVHILDLLAQEFDYVVIDTPPTLESHVLAAFDESDVVALLATLDIPALKNLKLTIETLDLIGYPRERTRVVLNRADSKVGLNLGEVEKTLKAPIVAQIPSSRDVPAATNRGVPIMVEDPKHPVSVAIRTFTERHVYQPLGDDAIPAQMRADRRGLRRRRR